MRQVDEPVRPVADQAQNLVAFQSCPKMEDIGMSIRWKLLWRNAGSAIKEMRRRRPTLEQKEHPRMKRERGKGPHFPFTVGLLLIAH